MENHWAKYDYGPHALCMIPECSGVYVISKVNKLHGYIIESDTLYVGQSKNLRLRTKQHLSPSETNPFLWGLEDEEDVEIAILRAPVSQLDDIERDLIEKKQPPGNRKRGNGRSSFQEQVH